MINSKLLAVLPMSTFKPGTDEFFVALACHVDAGDDLVDLANDIGNNAQTVSKLVAKGREIRDRLIREESTRMLAAIEAGHTPAPKVVQLVVTRAHFVSPPRGIVRPEVMTMH